MRHFVVGAVAFLLMWTAGCTPTGTTQGPSETTTSEGRISQAPAGEAAAKEGNALVRFINADPSDKGMDILLNDEPLFTSVAYKKTTPYMEVPRGLGQIGFKLRETGGKEILYTSRRELLFGRHYTLVALPIENHTARLSLTMDNLFLLEPGRARVRLINATRDVDDVDLYAATTKNILQHGIDATTVTSFTDVDAGVLEIRPANRPAPPQLSNLKVEADHLYTFVVVGTAAALDLIQIEDRIEGDSN